MDERLRYHMDTLRRDGTYQYKIDAATAIAQRYNETQKNLQNARSLFIAHAYGLHAKIGFEVIQKDSRLRQFVIDSVKTIANVMKGAMK
jgi:ribonuclease HIII